MTAPVIHFADARAYCRQIRRLYAAAFPRSERVPLPFLRRRTVSGRDEFSAVVSGGEFIGLTYTIRMEQLVYVFFLAVEEKLRGQGWGSRILQEIIRRHEGCTVILCIEDTADAQADNLPQRLSRLRFYERNGLKQLHVRVREAGVVYELLGTAEGVTREDFLRLMRAYFGRLLFRLMYRRQPLT